MNRIFYPKMNDHSLPVSSYKLTFHGKIEITTQNSAADIFSLEGHHTLKSLVLYADSHFITENIKNYILDLMQLVIFIIFIKVKSIKVFI